tara:strand:- start:6295 stop:7764 length:1470 start_codon:yes stop_codon:yes gene_type:complete
MKITLINPYDFSGPGIRSVTATLRSKGYKVQTLFLLMDSRFLAESTDGMDCNEIVIAEILKKSKDSDLVGITLMTNAFKMAINISQNIKEKLKIPVIWGGIHPTISPDECLDHADMICMGEGEIPMLNLAEKIEKNLNYLDIEGIWSKVNGTILKNKIPPPIQDLDSLPIDNYENCNDQVLRNDRFTLVNQSVASEFLGSQISVFSTRGCPYRCSFCCNNALNSLYKKHKILRYKSPPFMVQEIKNLVSRHKNIKRVFFNDDSFIVRSVEDIKEFTKLYKKHIDLPFSCQITAPSVREEIIKLLVNAGLDDARIGLQSASAKILKLYDRPISPDQVKRAAQIINKYFKDDQLVSYDIILDNPYETKKNIINTLRFLISLPKPFSLRFYSLQLYPGTQLFSKVESEGDSSKFRDSYYNSYRSVQGSYLNALFYLVKFIGLRRCPLILGKILLKNEMLFLLDNPLTDGILKILRNIRSFFKYSLFRPNLVQ